MPFADINLGEALLVAFEVFFFVIWIWILITIISDLFRDHELSGWAPMILSEPPGLMRTYRSPISPLVLIDAIESSWSLMPGWMTMTTRAW